MTEHVLVAIDGSQPGERALEYAFEQFPEAEITVLTAIAVPGTTALSDSAFSLAEDDLMDALRQQAEERLDVAAEVAAEYDIEIARVKKIGNPATAIIEYAEDHDIDHIVVGSHGRSGISRIVLGSVAEKVLRQAPAPVIVVR